MRKAVFCLSGDHPSTFNNLRDASGYRVYVVHFDLRESITEVDVEIVCQAALEKHPEAKPRIISDHGPQFIANDFKEFVRFSGVTHLTTSPYYPQSNGKLERYHGTIKKECIRPSPPRDRNEAAKQISSWVKHYNEVRLHSAIGYITPADCLCGLADTIHAENVIESSKKHTRADEKLWKRHLQLQVDVRNSANLVGG